MRLQPRPRGMHKGLLAKTPSLHACGWFPHSQASTYVLMFLAVADPSTPPAGVLQMLTPAQQPRSPTHAAHFGDMHTRV
eukprot:360291-Chlamydomonas_euryale.AAC.6